MIRAFVKILIGVLLLLYGWDLATVGDKFTSVEEIKEAEYMCANGIKVTGALQDGYEEIDAGVGKLKFKIYEFKYIYMVDSIQHIAKATSNLNTSAPTASIWYDKNSPDKNTMSNPCAEAKRFKEKKRIGNKWLYYGGGALMMLVGFGLSWGNFKALLILLFKRNK